MRRKLPASLIALVVCASLWPFDSALAQRRRRPARGGGGAASAAASAARAANANRATDARVAQIADAYLRGHYEFNPSEATSAGRHEFDPRLEER
ncbi:MAG TPA: hypothetical protein VF668_17985, partial [Pyrinomonadaceae bacterium]